MWEDEDDDERKQYQRKARRTITSPEKAIQTIRDLGEVLIRQSYLKAGYSALRSARLLEKSLRQVRSAEVKGDANPQGSTRRRARPTLSAG